MEKLQKYALGNDDIKQILGETVIFRYPELEYVEHIDEIFDEQGRSIMLFLTDSDFNGHWCCFLKKGNEIHYFDPYGLDPEEPKEWISKTKLEDLNQTKPFLMNLLKNSGYKIYINHYPFQKEAKNVATCGKHCVVRLLNKNKNLDQYLEMIVKSKEDPDVYVCGIVYNLIKK
jgi:hypothetical protein